MTPPVQRFSHAAMATVFEVHCDHDDARYAGQAAQAAFDLVDRLERDLSRFVANSDISRVNQLGAGQSTRVGPSTIACLELSRHMHELTGGAFDISIGSGLDGLDLVSDELRVHARTDGVRLDLGGIGKGYAVDRVAELLEEWDVRRALIHGGFSSVLALEPPQDLDGWPLTLSAPGPGNQAVLARISARQKALSASGTQKGDHIRDPRTGEPARSRAVWVTVDGRREEDERSPAALAEALSTAFMLLPEQEIASLCRRCPGIEVWLVDEPAPDQGAGPVVVHLVAPLPAGGGAEKARSS